MTFDSTNGIASDKRGSMIENGARRVASVAFAGAIACSLVPSMAWAEEGAGVAAGNGSAAAGAQEADLGSTEGDSPLGTLSLSAFAAQKEADQANVAQAQTLGAAPLTANYAYNLLANGSAQDIVSVALGEPDGVPEGGQYNKYNNYSGYDWCAYFTAWCARQAGVSADVIPDDYYCPTLLDWFEVRGQWHNVWSGYTPKAGDLMFYSYQGEGGEATHVGLITAVDANGNITSKEGNVNGGEIDTFTTRKAGTSGPFWGMWVLGYASPSYNDPAPAPFPGKYGDVDPEGWYADAVDFVSDNGLMYGYEGQNRFGVGDTMTRAQLATTLWRWAKPDDANGYDQSVAANETSLPDVESNAFYTGAANWAVSTGVISGVEEADGSRTFRPNDPVTFEQMVAMIANLTAKDGEVESADPSKLDGFMDGADVDDWARQTMAWGVEAGVFSGSVEQDGLYIYPGVEIPRERAAGLLYNRFNY